MDQIVFEPAQLAGLRTMGCVPDSVDMRGSSLCVLDGVVVIKVSDGRVFSVTQEDNGLRWAECVQLRGSFVAGSGSVNS